MSNTPLIWLAIIGGYLLVMGLNPARACFRDGWLAIRRYRLLWVTLGALSFCHALYELLVRVYLHTVLPPAIRPTFVWAREAWRDPHLWLSGSPESLWYLPTAGWQEALQEGWSTAFENLAGLFNNLVTTFPIAALAALLLLCNWGGHHRVLIRSLRQRFGHWSWFIHLGILLCALAALANPLLLYAAPAWLPHAGPGAAELWFQWAPVLAWLSFLFEYLFGVGIQIYLILLAYLWIRGLSFSHQDLLDVAIRRLSYVFRWALWVMLLSTVLIDAPLILKNFTPFSSWWSEENLFKYRLKDARLLLSCFLILTASIQVTLTLHSESLKKAWQDHFRFLRRNAWPFTGFLLVAGLHFFALAALDGALRRGFGEGSALWVGWSLGFPWLAGVISAWLLASWVCLNKRFAAVPSP